MRLRQGIATGTGVLATAILVVLALPALALALRPGRVLVRGSAEAIAPGPSGSIDIAYDTSSQIRLCVLPAGRTSCTTHVIDPNVDPLDVVALSPGPGNDIAVATDDLCGCENGGETDLFSSDDGGVSWTAPSDFEQSTDGVSGAFGPAGQFFAVLGGGLPVTYDAALGTAAAPPTSFPLIHDHQVVSDVAGWSGSTEVAVFSGRVTRIAVHAGSSSAALAGDWTDHTVPGSSIFPTLAQGRHLYLLQDESPGDRLEVRRFTGATFGPPHRVPTGGTALSPTLAESPGGDLVVGWDWRGVLHVSASGDGGVRWSRPLAIADHVFFESSIRIGLGRDGRGWVLYSPGPTSGPIRGVAIDVAAQLRATSRPRRRARHST